ncbi:MAG TPA: aminotransferase class V-fold PLP-dependent enzyme [Gaiellaceae bacterium]|nr:aminotransferase class V-fold PLP-dependent enzyme [Gaiellaceae bacterium]
MLAPSEYEASEARGYLDTGTYGLPPRSSVEAVERALAGWRGRAPWRRWEDDGEACRALFAGLVGASPEDVALLPAASVAAGLVAASLAAGRGDNVVLCEDDFTSTLLPWRGLERSGVDLRLTPLDELASAVDARTRLVAVSSVQSADGARADVDALRATGVPLFVDATQAVGAVPVAVDGIAYLAAHPYKWLLAPRGLAFLYVRRDLLAAIEPWTAGWKSRASPYETYYGIPELTPDARRLDVSLPWLVAAGARPSLELLAELGAERVAEHDLALARRFAAGLGLPEPASPIVRVRIEDAAAAVERLRAAGIACSVRAGSVRFCFHLYNDEADVDLALEALEPAVAGQAGHL